MLNNHLKITETESWVRALPCVQFAKNNSYHRIIWQKPYVAAFGCHPACESQHGDELSEEVDDANAVSAGEE